MNPRSIFGAVKRDLAKKLVLISGPRQVGKTTLAKALSNEAKGLYLNYDHPADREQILKRAFPAQGFICLDEFHKHERWKAWCKGLWDKHGKEMQLLLTGSARMDIFQKSGDSLMGRYFLHHLHPFTLGELGGAAPSLPEGLTEPGSVQHGLQDLLRFGGFPEPLFAARETEHNRWSQMRRQQLIQEEVRELTQVHLLNVLEELMITLPERIGNLFSYRSLSENLKVSVPTIQNWLAIFERLFIVYRLSPWSASVTRSLRRQPKYFFWDWSQVPSAGGRFENCVASHLFKAVSLWNDLGLVKNASLHFLHDGQGREVDFLVAKDRKPYFLVEAKLADEQVSPALRYYCRRLNIPGIQVLATAGISRSDGQITVVSAERWLGKIS
jgi:hypothetical protein